MLGNKIKELRRQKKLTQAQLAEKLNVTRSAVALWEIDNTDPDLENVIAIADFFDITTDYLLGVTDDAGRKTYGKTFNNHIIDNHGTINQINQLR